MKKELICLGHKITVLNPSGNYDMVEGVTPPHVPGPPPHYHSGYNELFYVLEGKMAFMVDGKTSTVEAGESVDLPPNTLHTFSNEGDVPCRWLNVHSPKGFLSFFETYGVDANQEDAFAKSVDGQVINSVIQESTQYDMHIQLPQLPA